MSGLGLTFLRRGGQAHPTAGSDYIKFKDDAVFNLLMSKGISADGVGITKEDAAKVTSIGQWFYQNTAISSFDEFEFFTGVTSLTTNAFLGASLASIKFPNSLATIGPGAFARCKSLAIELDAPYVKKIERAAFLQTAITSVNAPNLETLTGANAEGAFGSCTSLTKANIGKAKSVAQDCFNGCKTLNMVDMDWENVTSFATNAFVNCTSLYFDELNLPNLTSLGQAALHGVKIKRLILGKVTSLPYADNGALKNYGERSVLEYLDLPETLQSINANAFVNYTALRSVIIRATTPPALAATNAFANTTCIIYVPDASVGAYQSAANWSTYAARIKGISEYNG